MFGACHEKIFSGFTVIEIGGKWQSFSLSTRTLAVKSSKGPCIKYDRNLGERGLAN